MTYNPIQKQRLGIMRAIAQAMKDEDAVLKGGTGLLLCYELDRFSEDMDFDGYGNFNLDRVKKLISRAFEKQGTKITQIITKKDTPTTKRLMFHYDVSGSPEFAYPLKVEFSFRQSFEIEDSDIVIIDGIKVYQINKLAEKKFGAFMDRTALRDIYDVAFLLKKYPASISINMAKELLKINQDDLLTRFENDKADDILLSSVDGVTLIYNMFENAQTLVTRDRVNTRE